MCAVRAATQALNAQADTNQAFATCLSAVLPMSVIIGSFAAMNASTEEAACDAAEDTTPEKTSKDPPKRRRVNFGEEQPSRARGAKAKKKDTKKKKTHASKKGNHTSSSIINWLFFSFIKYAN